MKITNIILILFSLFSRNESQISNNLIQQESQLCSGIISKNYWSCHNVSSEFFGGDFRKEHIKAPHEISESDLDSFSIRKCFCDSKCVKYGDCCADVMQRLLQENVTLERNDHWKCFYLPGAPKDLVSHIYMYSKCPESWPDDINKFNCEFFPNTLNDYKMYIPVTSAKTNITYRNYFCAICNKDMTLEKWNVQISCVPRKISNIIENGLLNPNNFNSFDVSWKVQTGGKKLTCYLQIKQFRDSLGFLKKHGSRQCKPMYETCKSGWSNKVVENKCRNYAFFVHLKRSKVDWGYKNYHCAQCNGISVENLSCLLKTLGNKGRLRKRVSLTILFDFDQFTKPENKCKFNETYDFLRKKCVRLFTRRGRVMEESFEPKSNNFNTISCEKIVLEMGDFSFLPNSSIFVNHTRKIYEPNQFELVDPKLESNSEVAICKEENGAIELAEDYTQTVLTSICLVVSIILLFLHILCYLIVPKLQNLPGKNLLNLSFSLLIAQILFLIGGDSSVKGVGCVVVGMFVHFFFMAYFLWMNVMAFDIYHTLRGDTFKGSRGNKMFYRYSIYVWVIAFAIVFVAIMFDYLAPINSPLRPQYGQNLCWFNQKYAMVIFFFAPFSIILVANIIMFFITIKNIRKTDQVTKRAVKRSDTARFYLYIKLGTIMGLTWVLAFVAAFVKSAVVWYIFIIFDGLQGAFIFFAFSFKKKVLRLAMDSMFRRRSTITSSGRNRNTRTTSSTMSTNFTEVK